MIYLDSAATSLLKPACVRQAVIAAMSTAASPGRGSHPAAERAAEICYDCRETLARLFNVKNPENIVFTTNATHGLNIAINTQIKAGRRVLISGWEHNAVTRPLHALGAETLVADTPLFDTEAFLDCFARKLKQADSAVLCHVSNVFGCVLPLGECAALCRESGKPLTIDASQSAGALDIDFEALGADFIAMPGHKGLMGPQGTGVLICKNGAEPLMYGGTGSNSRSSEMPHFLPDRLEAGTHNVPGIAGLAASAAFVLRLGLPEVRRREAALMETFCGELQGADGVTLFRGKPQAAVLSMLPRGADVNLVGEKLGKAGVAVRAGLHCAPLAHSTAGTLETGTVRFSFSPLLSPAEAAKAARITKAVVSSCV
ncbi:MAG: aminotransferase class V-fold PLP-dependent enzyme [Oscillospiraceae bacterium]|nr:aminotransferase class V-fold PLP-dependent enzyme [Oscillospiraceae bacterium]